MYALRFNKGGGSDIKKAHQWRKLEVISNEDKLLCEPKGAKTRRQSDLGRFVDDAVVKLSPRKEWTREVDERLNV